MGVKELQPQDWYDLRYHVYELDADQVTFLFPESNAPKFTPEILNSLREHFGMIEINRPLVELPPAYDEPLIKFASGGLLYVTLHFKSKDKAKELLHLIGIKNDQNLLTSSSVQ